MTSAVPAVLALLAAVSASPAAGPQTPHSYAEPARVDTPILRVPFLQEAPTIDGTLAEGEWTAAGGLSGFWYDFTTSNFRFLAPVQTQVRVYAGFDRENLYLAFSSPVYPKDAWLRSRGRFPDVLMHPQYGVLWDDHSEIELRPYHDATRGFRLGLLRFDINPIGNVVDWNWTREHGEELKWRSGATVRCKVTGDRWTLELAAPMKALVTHGYKGVDENGRPLVPLPPPDGTAWRCWLTRGIGGNGRFFNVFDNHMWNTTKTKLIFDRQAVSFQINQLGPIMEDVIDVTMTVRNHAARSQTVRLGFFVENASGNIYSSYVASELNDGLLELRPGEVRKVRLRQPLPGINRNGNVLWFDVRSAGRPAKVLFRTRLIRFHSMEGGSLNGVPFRKRRLEVIAEMRPPREDFRFMHQFSIHTRRVSGIVDVGLAGGSDEAKSAVRAQMTVTSADAAEREIAKETRPIVGDFACFVMDLPGIVEGESYKTTVLLFDRNGRIVAERVTEPFVYDVPVWLNTTIGTDDVVWEPFTPMQPTAEGFETLKHVFTLAPSGLPAQVHIRPDVRELPLERRDRRGEPSAEVLREIGRGDQLRGPLRLEAVIDGKRVAGRVVQPAKRVREWKSEREYRSQLVFGDLPVELVTQYDCDGSIHCRLTYGGKAPARIDLLELVAEMDGYVDLATSGGGGMAGANPWVCKLPDEPGVVWDNGGEEFDELYYSHFTPWFKVGSADRMLTFYCDSESGWRLNRKGASITLERDGQGRVTWRTKFVNHPVEIRRRRTIDFHILVHPAKPKPPEYRKLAWHYVGVWAHGYMVEPIELPEQTLHKNWRRNAGAPRNTPESEKTTFRKDAPPWFRHGRLRNFKISPECDQTFRDKTTYWYEKRIRIGRRVGGWWDEIWPPKGSNNLATGNAYLRDPNEVRDNELPWHRGYLTRYIRDFFKRIGREYARNNVPNRNCTWANHAATLLESFVFDTMLVEECGAGNRSYDIDQITQYPNSLIRMEAHNYTGLVARYFADATPAGPGDDKRFDRQMLGRALLNDLGVNCNGPHGVVEHREQAIRLLQRLTAFGFFRDGDIERIPHWRAGRFVRFGDAPAEESEVWVTVYRRPLDAGKGYKALLVVVNESEAAVQAPVALLDVRRLIGGPNTQTGRDVLAQARATDVFGEPVVPEALADWWAGVREGAVTGPALRDFETGEAIGRSADRADAERYGPVFVPHHDFRILYLEHKEGER